MKHLNYKKETLSILKDLVDQHPTQLLSTHLSMALSDYGKSFDSISDKELYYIFEKYKCMKELDVDFGVSDDISDILKDGMNLDINIEDEEEDF